MGLHMSLSTVSLVLHYRQLTRTFIFLFFHEFFRLEREVWEESFLVSAPAVCWKAVAGVQCLRWNFCARWMSALPRSING